MVYVTGDTHGMIDFEKMLTFAEKHPALTKKDYVIVAGDFGGVWMKKYLAEDLKRYEDLPFTVLFVDGNHENFDLLYSYPVEVWKGGKIHRVSLHVFAFDARAGIYDRGQNLFYLWRGNEYRQMLPYRRGKLVAA